MRSLGLVLFVAVALFGSAIASNSPRLEAAAAYRDYVDAIAVYQPEWRALRDAKIVDIEVDDYGHVDASLRADGCTLPTLDAHIYRDGDRGWNVQLVDLDQLYPAQLPVCKEGGEIPPPELAWTWQGRSWR